MRFDFDIGVLVDSGEMTRMLVRSRAWEVVYDG